MNLKMEVNGVTFEIEPTGGLYEGGEQPTGVIDNARELATRTFDEVVETVSKIAEAAGERFQTMGKGLRPDEVKMSFSVGVKAGAGIVIKSVEASGNFTVELKWTMKQAAG